MPSRWFNWRELTIAALNPNKLLLIDNSEPSLYEISSELKKQRKNNIVIETFLGDAKDETSLRRYLRKKRLK